MKIKKLSAFLLLVFCLACQENFSSELLEEIESPQTDYNPNLPHGLYFTTPGNTFYNGQTVLGWENLLIQRGQASPEDRASHSYVSDCATSDHLKLYKNGVYIRDISSSEAFLYYEYTPSTILQRFEWTIPFSQPAGTGYQLQLWWGNCLPGPQGDMSLIFDITNPVGLEIISPVPWKSVFEQGEQLPFGMKIFCPTASGFTAKIYKGSQFKDQRVFSPSGPNSLGWTSVSASFGLPASAYPVGTDYRVVFELNCNGNNVIHTEYFSVIEGTGGGIAPPDILFPGW